MPDLIMLSFLYHLESASPELTLPEPTLTRVCLTVCLLTALSFLTQVCLIKWSFTLLTFLHTTAHYLLEGKTIRSVPATYFDQSG